MMTKPSAFNPDDYPNKVCCGVIEYLRETGFELPFYIPILIRDGNLVSDGFAIKLFQATKDGKPRTSGTSSIFISYCPFCGKEIDRKQEKP